MKRSAGIKEINIVGHPSNKPRRMRMTCGVHAGGQDDHMEDVGPRMRAEEVKLRRRIELCCRPQNLLGHLIMAVRRRRLIRKMRARFVRPYAMFVAGIGTRDEKPPYDPLAISGRNL